MLTLQRIFSRTATSNNTLNVFFDRKYTEKNHSLLPKAFESLDGYKKYKFFHLNKYFISSVLVEVSQSELYAIYENPGDETKPNPHPYNIRVFNNTKIDS
ncbi:hypothetical protein H8356DRAFT_1341208 [Neocallimastix lanati (nom. inval.)]|nr:hypothetical protein H8356DRAFT_1341208 [Neocallimastix sp. JGI-2020a]